VSGVLGHDPGLNMPPATSRASALFVGSSGGSQACCHVFYSAWSGGHTALFRRRGQLRRCPQTGTRSRVTAMLSMARKVRPPPHELGHAPTTSSPHAATIVSVEMHPRLVRSTVAGPVMLTVA
jgi:hypothetical protein